MLSTLVPVLIMFSHRKGDYHRYLAEFASGEKRKVAATAAHEAYKVINHCTRSSDQIIANHQSERY